MKNYIENVEDFKDVVLQCIFNKKMVDTIKETTGSDLGGFLYPSTDHALSLLEFLYEDEDGTLRSIVNSWSTFISLHEDNEVILNELNNQLDKLFVDFTSQYIDEEEDEDVEQEQQIQPRRILIL